MLLRPGLMTTLVALVSLAALLFTSLQAKANYPFTSPYLSFTAPPNVTPLAVGDLNQDGKLDLVCAGWLSHYDPRVSVGLGRGDATFEDLFNVTAGSYHPEALVLGDVNSDGNKDLLMLATSNFGPGLGHVSLGSGDGHFAAPSQFSTVPNPASALLADLDNDGDLDLVVSSRGGNSVWVHLGAADGTFGVGTSLTTGSSPYDAVAVDLNGDTRLDIVTVNYGSNSISVLLGIGGGAFGAKSDFPSGLQPIALASGDLNGDSKPDLVVANEASNTVSVFRGNGLGGFGTRTDFVTATQPSDVQVGDFNGDARLDVAVTCIAANVVSAFLGNGSGSLGVRSDYGSAQSPSRLAIADLNGDSRPELITTCTTSATVTVHPGNTNGSFGRRIDMPGGTSLRNVALGDLNGDSIQDAVTVSGGNADSISVHLGIGGGVFGARTDFSVGNEPEGIALGDFDNDGDVDLATANTGAASITVLMGTGTGSFGGRTDLGTGSSPRRLVTFDANEDGALDLAVSAFGSSLVSIHLGTGTGSFAAAQSFPTGSNPVGITFGDINGDGHADVATANFFGASVSVLLGDGSGAFGPPIHTPCSLLSGPNPYALSLGDLDQDNRPDIAVVNNGRSTLTVLIGNGDGAFGLKPEVATGPAPTGVAVTDVDGDGLDDVLIVNEGSGTFGFASSFLGTGDGSLEPRVDYGTGASPTALAVGDITGDLLPDFVAVNAGSNRLSSHLNRGPPPAVDRVPAVFAPPNATIGENHEVSVGVSAMDPDLQQISFLVADLAGLPAGNNASFTVAPGNAAAILTWTPSYEDARPNPYTITFTANNSLSGSASTLIQVTNVDRVPAVSAPNTVPGTEGTLVTFGVTASDPDGDPISSLTAVPLPAGASFSTNPAKTSGTLTWTPTFTQAGQHTVRFIASAGLSSSDTTIINVTNVDRSPVVTAPQTVTGSIGNTIQVSILASDPDAEALSLLTANPLPPGATFAPAAGNVSGTLTWVPGSGQEGTYPVEFTAGNALVGTATTVITVVTQNLPPSFTAAASLIAYEGELFAFSPVATDPEGSTLAYSFYHLPLGAALNSGSGAVSWTPSFLSAGAESLCLIVSDGELEDTLVVSVAIVDVPPAPLIVGVIDIPNDQGRQVDLHWKRSEYDKTGDGVLITGYAVYRRIDPLPVLPSGALRQAQDFGPGPLLAFPPGDWQYLVTVPAVQEPNYHYVATTLADSTMSSGQHLTTFFLSALTDQPEVHFDGQPGSGYSVDNLAPSIPTSFQAAALPGPIVRLTWNRVHEADIRYYSVHRGATPNFAPSESNQVTATSDTTAIDEAPTYPEAYYKVLAVDYAGNASAATTALGNITGIEASAEGVTRVLLRSPRPNPTSRDARMEFAVPRSGRVEVQILSVDGRLVRTLTDSHREAGNHSVQWGLNDQHGRPVANGLYIVRLRSAGETKITKVAVIR